MGNAKSPKTNTIEMGFDTIEINLVFHMNAIFSAHFLPEEIEF